MLDQNLIDYIKKASSQGISQQTIKDELLKVGWDLATVNEALNHNTTNILHNKSKYPKPLLITSISIIVLILGFIGYKMLFKQDEEIPNQTSPVESHTDKVNNDKNKETEETETVNFEFLDPIANVYPDTYCAMMAKNTDEDLDQDEQIIMSDEQKRIWLECSENYDYSLGEGSTMDLSINEGESKNISRALKVLLCSMEENMKSDTLQNLRKDIISAVDKQKYNDCITHKAIDEKTQKFKDCTKKADTSTQKLITSQCSGYGPTTLGELISCGHREAFVFYGLTDNEIAIILKFQEADKQHLYNYTFNGLLVACLNNKL